MPGFSLRRVVHSIFTRVTLLGVALVIVAAVARYFVLSDFLRDSLSSLVAEQQLSLASYVAKDVDYKLSERRSMLEKLAQALPRDLLSRPRALRAWLQEHHDYHPLFSVGLLVLDENGKALADYPAVERGDADYADRDYFQAALSGAVYIGRPVLGRVSGEPILPMAAPVKDVEGSVVAVLVGATALAAPGFLDALLQTRAADDGGFLLVSARDQVFVTSSQPDMVLRPTPPKGVNLLHDRAMAGYRGSGVTVNAQGVEELAAMVSVPSADWFIVARLPTAEAFATLGLVQRFVIKNAVLAVFIITIIFSAFMYWLFRPLLRAASQADRMTLGQIPLEPLAVVRDDEVGHLIAAFNRLLGKLREQQENLAQIAHHDTLTGLPNRLLLSDRLGQAVARARRKESRLALFFLDLDGFKPINDTLGHEGGDEALRQVAERFLQIVRQGDTLARVGGDEFVLLISDLEEDAVAAVAAVTAVAGKFIEALQVPFMIFDRQCRLGVSIGIALRDGACDPHEFMLAADRAMYRAKEAGRGCFSFDDCEAVAATTP